MIWFAEGDRNTSFFHNHVNGKRKKLQLKRIKSGSGVCIEDQEQLATTAVEFYQKQFTNEGDASEFSLLNNVPSMVTMDQNLELSRLPTIEEVRADVFELSGDSASGPDGFNVLFYQTCWDVIGADIHNMVLSRVLHDRLESLLPSLISPNQSEFIKGRSIFENILLTQEIVTDIRLSGKPANVVIKLDMAKAYDRVSWKYLLHVLRKMGFSEHFINMVWSLISNNWYSVLVNGKSSRFFKSTRGVKQGDPLSPALFILSAEVLSKSLNKLFEDRSFVGFGMPKWSDPLNHLAYADDTIIFASAYLPSLSKIMAVLGNYEKISVLDPTNNILEHLHKIFARFFWSTKEEGRSRHWASWQNLFLPTEEGGLGFRSLHDVSRALFAKLWWRFRTTKSLWSNFTWNKYCKKELPTVVHFRKGSHVWRQMLNAREEVEHEIEVAELRQGEIWDVQLLDQTFNEEVSEHIRLNMHYEGNEGYWDRPYWMPTPSGKFSVSSAWQILRHRADPNKEFKLMWIKGVPFKISFFLWRLWRQKIATDDMWRRKGHCFKQYQLSSLGSFGREEMQLPFHDWYKCNTDGASKGNPGPSSLGFCVRDDEGDMVYTRAVDMGVTTNVVAEAKAILQGLEYCVEHDLHPLILETDSLVMKKVIEGEWDPPWVIAQDVKKIIEMKENFNVVFQHVFREGRRLINLEKSQSPNLRVRIAKRRTTD
ncbi:uncharacterized protein [Nicotiana tomentosiformis]|uniref:uncharacterized protein n=1 Tax=Nicotiana tomentosiformis TaxID=4098 RepID=UPI00388C6CB8